ncbi:MAG: HDIG domain-containing protein [Candidatus Zixiibacteriota bacterium]|nr:MAG: HDIG domain-containing protein [candidate division Zixibacteria bacterium]
MSDSLNPELIKKINARGKLYEVGGSVRDSLIDPSIEIKDRDYLVTGIPYDRLAAILDDFGRVDLVGKSFGVIKFTQRGAKNTVDVVIPRKEISTGTAHRDFSVDYDPNLPIEEDLKRRDFTINAIARAIPSGEIIDPFGGREDIGKKIIRIVFPDSIVEDPLRILRGAQFAARFEFKIESETLQKMKEAAHLIDTISPERISEELNKMLLKADKPSIGFRYLLEVGVLERIMPYLAKCVGVEQPGGYHRWDVFDHTMVCVDNAPNKLNVRLAALFHDLGKPDTRELVENGATFYGHDRLSTKMAVELMRNLKYSNDLIDQIRILVEKHMFSDLAGEKGVRRLIKSVGIDLIYDLLDLRRADIIAQGLGQDPAEVDDFEAKITSEIEKKSPFGVRDLAINGNDLMEKFGLEEGPLIGQILNGLLEIALDEPQMNTREILLSKAADFLRNSIDI